MTDERQKPPVVTSYAQGIAARNAEREEVRRQNPVFPNLGQAAVTHDPRAATTLAEVARVQRSDAANGGPAPTQLSEQTVKGLTALHQVQEAKNAERRAQEAATPPKPAPEKKPAGADPEDDLLDEEDAAFAAALRSTKRDVIQNDAERQAVAERVLPLDLAQGLLTGEYTQDVPIVPGRLDVRFRCLTTRENNALRLLLVQELEEEPQRTRFAPELLGFYQTVAMTVSINGSSYAKHMIVDPATMQQTFERDIFVEKVRLFMDFPMPLIAALGTHSSWFELRVRQLFATTDALKNG